MKREARKSYWRSSQLSSVTKPSDDYNENVKIYWHKDKLWSKGLLLYKTGGLKFKQYWKIGNSNKFKDSNCPAGCKEVDNLEHMKLCIKMTIRWNDVYDNKLEMCGDYLIKANRERVMKFNLPII